MKAIKITQKLKDDNPNLFGAHKVGQIIRFNPPKTLVIDGVDVHGINRNEELQNDAGFKDLTIPQYDKFTQKLGKIKVSGNGYTYEIVDLSDEDKLKQLPKTISKLSFKKALLQKGIKNSDVLDLINQQESPQKDELLLLWNEADYFEIDNPYLYAFAPELNISEADIHEIFKNYGE